AHRASTNAAGHNPGRAAPVRRPFGRMVVLRSSGGRGLACETCLRYIRGNSPSQAPAPIPDRPTSDRRQSRIGGLPRSTRTVLATCSLVVLLFLCRPGTAAAQPGAAPDPLDADRAMAKARFAADQTTFADLARQRVEAAEEIHYQCMHPNPWLC